MFADQPLWEVPELIGRPLVEDREAGVAIIGAGIAGLLVATELQRRGHDVLVIDRASAGGVATRRTTAKVTALQGTVLQTIRAHRGEAAARLYALAQQGAVTEIARLIDELAIDCHATPASACTFATEDDAAPLVDRELDAMRAAGLPVRSTTELDLPFPVTAGVVLDDQLHVDAGELCEGLARALGDLRLATGTTVTGVTEDATGCEVTTVAGNVVRAGHVVVATQAPIVDPWLLSDRCRPMQSYGLAGRLDGLVPRTMYLSCDELPISLRPVELGGELGIIVVGAGHPVGATPDGPPPWEILARWVHRNLGPLDVTHRWATHDLTSTDRVPYIGRLHGGSHRRLVATGFGKWGFTNAQVAARLLADAIEGGPSADAAVFDSTRLRTTVNLDYLERVGTAVRHLVVDRVTGRPEPRCTHQGCVMRRDDALGGWECPCHGSRFDADGVPRQGPAIRSLPPRPAHERRKGSP